MKSLLISAVLLGCLALPVHADDLVLTNGDQLSGKITSEDKATLTLEHEVLGVITLERAFVKEVRRQNVQLTSEAVLPATAGETPKVSERSWTRALALGAGLTTGNTEESEFSGRLGLNGKTDSDEWTFELEGYVSEKDESMNARRYNSLLRYAYSFGDSLAWYHFTRATLAHDRFADVDYRLTPATGVGYWFSDEAPFKAMAEAGLGWERTEFRLAGRRSEPVLVSRGWAEWTLPRGGTLTEELSLLPRLGDDAGEFRIKAEAILSHPLSDQLSVKLRLVDEYDSDPASGTKNNDLRLTSELGWSF